ncbi:MAG: tRNA (adenosine(37)-N6)-dimethylallyltransferase MiaA [Pseudomonadota bacterium]
MTEETPSRIVLIAGPTAGGKSALALALAQQIDGEILNADAMQVYRDLNVLSARPGTDDLARARHHLFGVLSGASACSAGRWARMAGAALRAVSARGRPAIVVGGTGLYFRALTDGLSPIPEIPEAVRRDGEARRAALGAAAFHAEVLAADPSMARVAQGDAQRLVRAWSVHAATGRPLSDFQAAAGRPAAPRPAARIVLEPPRAALYARCDARFDAMMAAGALDEARRLAGAGYAPDRPVMKALGAAELIAHVRGEIALDEAVEAALRNTRRFAKRQGTWFRGQTPDWPRAETVSAALEALKQQLGAPASPAPP